MREQETRKGTQGTEEIDTYHLLDKLKPEKKGRCRKGKSCDRVCLVSDRSCLVALDERVGVALSRAADFVRGRHQREAEVKAAAEEVRREVMKQQRFGR